MVSDSVVHHVENAETSHSTDEDFNISAKMIKCKELNHAVNWNLKLAEDMLSPLAVRKVL